MPVHPSLPRRARTTLALVAMLSAALAWIDTSARGQSPAPATVTLSVDATTPGPVISRHLFGQFAEHLGRGVYEGVWVGPESPIPNTRGIRSDVVAALKAIKVPNVRWPGGCFADEYHWRKGIGPAAQRPATLNPNWGGVIEPNSFGTHEFLDFIDQIGAEAFLSVNMGSGTPQEAAEWFEYLTTAQPTALAKERAANGHPAPYRIAFLGLGNESWDCGGNMSAEHYVNQMRAYARFVRNFNPEQQKTGQMRNIAVGPGGGEPRFLEWTETVMRAYQQKQWSWDMHGLSLHNYTVVKWPPAYKSVGFGVQEYADVLRHTLEMDRLITAHTAIMDRYDPEKKVALAVDEWGTWYGQLPGTKEGFLEQQNSIRDALVAALNINIFARRADRVRMANIAQMVNVLQAMILTDQARMVLTPTYHVFRMYVPFQEAASLPVTFDAGTYRQGPVTLPRVDAMGARDQAGVLWLSLVNLHPSEPVTIAAAVTGATARSAAGDTLTAPAVDSVNTFDAPTAVAPRPAEVRLDAGRLTVHLPARSVTVIGIRP